MQDKMMSTMFNFDEVKTTDVVDDFQIKRRGHVADLIARAKIQRPELRFQTNCYIEDSAVANV